MRFIALIASFVVTSLVIAGCGTKRVASIETKEHVRDSVRVEYRERVEWKHDTVTIEIPKQTSERAVKDTVSLLENDYAKSVAKILPSGELYHWLSTKPQKKPVEIETPIYHKEKTTDKGRTVTIERTKTIEVNRLTPWQKKQIAGFWVLSIVVLGYAGFVTRRLWLPLLRKLI